MNKQTLSTVTLETIDNCARAASLTLKAYRAGSSRLLDGVSHGLQTQVYSRSVKVAPNLTGAMTQLRDSLNDIIDGGVEKLSSRSERAISAGSKQAHVGVSRMAGFASKVKTPLLARSLSTAARLSTPLARAARALSAGVLEGAGRLSVLAGGSVSLKTVKKTAVRVKRKVATQVEAQVAAAPRKVAAVKKSADEAVVSVKRRTRKVVVA